MSKNKLLAVFGSLTLFIWLSSFAFVSIFSESFGRFAEFLILSFIGLSFFSNKISHYSINKKVVLIAIYFLIIITFSFAREILYGYVNNYTYILYFKTFFYTLLSLVFASRLFSVSRDFYFFEKIFLKAIIYSIVVCMFFFIPYFYSIGWTIGDSFLYTELGEDYQGLSRVFGFFLLALFFLRKYFRFYIVYPLLFLCVILVFSFNSFGVFLSILVIFLYYICKLKSFKHLASLLFLLLIIYNSINYFNVLNLELINDLVSRGGGKIDGGDLEEGRLWLVQQAYSLWHSDLYSFVFGPGPINYACHVNYCDTYRHPHNIFLLMLTWGGLASLPLIMTIIYITFILIKIFIKTDNPFLIFVSSLTLYYLLLSFIGGDIEQNRFLIFLMLFTYLNYKEFFVNDRFNSPFNLRSL